jgi:protein-disulfide isomerase
VRRRSPPFVGLASLVFALASSACTAPWPAAVRADLARAPEGGVTVVVFTDFQCPHCRRTHAALDAISLARPGRVRVMLRHVPLRMHPDAREAARAAVCAERLATPDVAEAFARALFTTRELGDDNVASLAAGVSIDPAALRRCTEDPETEARIEKDRALFLDAGGEGVPLVYVGRTRFDGSPPREMLENAVEEALAAKR